MASYYTDLDNDLYQIELAASEDRQGTRCKRCGQDGFVWERHQGRWRLHSEVGDLHVCERKATP